MGRSDDPFRKDSARNTRHAPWSASNKRSVYSILARDTAILPTSFAHHPAFPPISPPRRSRLIPHADRTLRLAPTIKSTNIKNLAFPRRQVPRPSLTFWSEGANPSVEEERDFPCERETRVSSAFGSESVLRRDRADDPKCWAKSRATCRLHKQRDIPSSSATHTAADRRQSAKW
jgi:hypothetical protein